LQCSLGRGHPLSRLLLHSSSSGGGSFQVTAPTDVPYWAGRVVRSNRFEIVKTGFADPAPTEKDRDYNGISAETQLSTQKKGTGVWCEASIEDVQANMSFTGYPSDRIHYVQGMVENTIPANMPDKIALLRLDTDWYASTKHELEHLYPLLEKGGVLLIDDYGHWQGAPGCGRVLRKERHGAASGSHRLHLPLFCKAPLSR